MLNTFKLVVLFWGKVVVFGQNGSIGANCFYLGELVLFGRIGSIWANWFYLGKSGSIGQSN